MDRIFTYFLYIVTLVLLGISFARDRQKTKQALIKAKNMFITILPQFAAILLLIALMLTIFDKNVIQAALGTQTGVLGMMVASLFGSVALVPVLIAFPVASELLKNGAGLMQITVFVSTLTTVGLITLPLERRYLGIKVALLRNGFFYIFSFLVAFAVESVL